MRMTELLTALESAGERLAVAARSAGLAAEVPSCPGWTVRDLVFHTGRVHRWAEAIVRERHAEYIPADSDPLREAAHRPSDDELLGWFADCHTSLLRTLREAPADLRCWSFLPAPSPLEFWVRRQAQETTMHRIDAELAAGELTPVETALAVDGIDELLGGFVARPRGKLRSELPKTLAVQVTDAPAAWRLTVSSGPVVTERTENVRAADATVRGPANDVYLALWNRLSFGSLDAFGDAELLGSWPKLVRVG